MFEKLKSRKFWVMLGTIVGLVVEIATGNIGVNEGLQLIVAAGGVYMAAQGYVDRGAK